MKLVTLLVFLALAPIDDAHSAPTSQQPAVAIAKPSEATAPTGRLSAKRDEVYEAYGARLDEERQSLERQSERQFNAVESLLNKAIWVISGVLGVAAIGFFLLFGQTRRELKASIKDIFEAKAKDVIEAQAAQLQSKYVELKRNVDALLAYKDRNIVWVSPHGTQPTSTVLSSIQASGFRNLNFATPEFGQEFGIGSPDLVILDYAGDEESRRVLSAVASRLKEVAPPVPLLIYCFVDGGEPVRIDNDGFAALQGYSWFIPVNFPAQLFAQLQLLVRQDRSMMGGV